MKHKSDLTEKQLDDLTDAQNDLGASVSKAIGVFHKQVAALLGKDAGSMSAAVAVAATIFVFVRCASSLIRVGSQNPSAELAEEMFINALDDLLEIEPDAFDKTRDKDDHPGH